MQKLFQPYRKTPREAKIYRETENEQFSTVIRREFLNLAAFPAENGFFLSCSLACRTRSLPGDWHRRINPAFLTVMYIHSGTTLLRINDESWRTEPGDIVLIPPRSDSEFGTETAGERSGIILYGGMLEGIVTQLRRNLPQNRSAESLGKTDSLHLRRSKTKCARNRRGVLQSA